ncbi:MAG: hypothetical protein EXR43_00990 [Dehalococcoidia bacterium]|nr:hypothetical protein [Dehalococcoidia bacterium]
MNRIALIAFVIATFFTATAAFADEVRTAGPYQVSLGFRSTPIYSEETNGVRVTVVDGQGRPVEGIAGSLKVLIGTYGRGQTLDFLPMTDRPGGYEAVFIAPSTGPYTLDLRGDIRGTAVNEHFDATSGMPGVITHGGYDYGSSGAFIAYAILIAYLIGIAGIAVVMLRRRRANRQGAATAH